MSKKGLLIIVHGSRDPKWCQPFEDFVQNTSTRLKTDKVRLCYMELVSPTLETVVGDWVKEGLTHIQVIPFFMASGGHVDNNIPKIIREAQAKYPHIQIDQLPPIGEHSAVKESMINVVATYLDYGG
ncbi:CbiX/SirB N-terminal domain-containing protein [bacterium]|jgi:sirohydrochlorin cobaltochelatase|nr:CbiX/SirB N-terminal domain-containing protein [bacterium]